jgi:DNA modification methylase
MTETLAEGVTIHMGDAREIAPTLPHADMVMTSPPYGQQRDYGQKIGDWRALVSGALAGIQDGGNTQVLVNLGLIHRDGEVVPYWEPFLGDMRAAGWRFFGWYVWDQGPGLPGHWNGRLAPAHEFVFHFNRTSRKPNKIVPCTQAGRTQQRTSSGLRRADGTIRSWCATDLTTQEFRIGDSVVRAMRYKPVRGIAPGHPAVFPVTLPHDLIASYTDPGEMVIDPFMGSGTTGVAAVKIGRRFTGIEIEPAYFDIARQRISAALAAPDMFIESPRLLRAETAELPFNTTGNHTGRRSG